MIDQHDDESRRTFTGKGPKLLFLGIMAFMILMAVWALVMSITVS